MKKLFLVFFFILISLINFWYPSTAQAEQDSLPPSVKISQNNPNPRFPDGIDFDLKASTGAGSPKFTKLEFSFRLVGEVETSVRQVAFEGGAGQPISAHTSLDTQKDYIPPGARLNYFWTFYDANGKAYVSPAQELTYNDTRFKFRELKSGVVTLRWYQGDDNFGRQGLNTATATIDKLGKLYQIEPKNPINITIYPDYRTMFTALPPNTAEWVGGQAFPSLGTIVLAITPGDLKEIGRGIPHEVSHQVVYQATRNPYNVPPKWLDEGLAVNNQEQVEGVLLETFERAVDKHTLVSLRSLNGAFPADDQESSLAYAESVKVVQYIITKYGQGAIAKMLAAFKEGVTYDEAVRRGTGIGLDELDREWKQSFNYPIATPVANATPQTAAKVAPVTSPTSETVVVNPVSPTSEPSATQIGLATSPRPAVTVSPASNSGFSYISTPLLAAIAALLLIGSSIGLVAFMNRKRR